MWLLEYGIGPEQRAELPAGVGAWLPAVAAARSQAQAEASRQAASG